MKECGIRDLRKDREIEGGGGVNKESRERQKRKSRQRNKAGF